MSCQDSSSSNSGYSYSHHETATAHIYPSSSANNLNARISLESTSTLHSSTPIFHQSSINNNINSWDIKSSVLTNGTPFSRQVLDLLSQYPLQRLLIRIGDAATSSSGKQYNDEQQLQQDERSRGPSGTSIYTTFATDSNNNNNHEDVKVQYQNQYASLLRYLLDNTLFPPCGAPLDSIRVRKHGHSTIVHSPITEKQQEGDETNIQSVNVESFLAADAATFCNPGIKSVLLSNNGWGSATNNGACQSSNDKSWGLFDALFPSSQSSALSDILLGSSLDAAPWESTSSSLGSNKRHSVWIDMQVSPSCFVSSSNGEECSVNVTRGTSYRVAMPHSANQNQRNTINLSLGDILLGHNTLKQSLSTDKKNGSRKEWHPCPLSDSSRILLYLPNGCGANFANEDFKVDAQVKGKMEFNVLTSNNGYTDLTAPWVQLSYDNEKISTPQSSLYGISRTVQRPLGIASSGTLISVVRYNSQSDAISTDSKLVKVKSLDVLPGTLVKPMMHTLRMILYQGDGAGGERFVPPSHSDEHCECNEADSSNNDDKASSDQCGLVCSKLISLSELQNHRITLHSDGTILLERTTLLQPDSSLWMMVDFDEAYLPFQKFPADANRGVDTYPSRATFTPLSSDETKSSLPNTPSTTLYSSSLLVLPPVPDMSMPFNVISLSCTLFAFVLGSLLNILVRRGTEYIKRELTGEEEKRPIHKIRDKFKEKAGKLKDKLKRLKSKLGRISAVESKVDANDEKEKVPDESPLIEDKKLKSS